MVKYISSKYLELDKLPQNINISTISATCTLGTTLVCSNKYKLVDNEDKEDTSPAKLDILIKSELNFTLTDEKKFSLKTGSSESKMALIPEIKDVTYIEKTKDGHIFRINKFIQSGSSKDTCFVSDMLKSYVGIVSNVNVNLNNIYKYLKLDKSSIFTVKFKNNVKSLEVQKKKKKKKKNCFQNQMTVEIKPDLPKYPDSKVSLKIFKNGSIQMSGIKCIQACNTVLNKLINELTREYGIIEDGKMVEISFIDDIDTLEVYSFKVDMINSGFQLNYEVNRENLYNQLLECKIECKFEPSIHAGVNIKFSPTGAEKKVSIFVFESGNIIITGAKKVSNILESYNYISKFMENNKQIIQKSKICEMLRDNISNELKEMIQIDDEEDLLALALREVSA
tara:strand:+ start:498 stop:1682 length:1185 start_codon:yes stop_codon:yes gene_type:complete